KMALILACTMSDILVNIPILISPIRLISFLLGYSSTTSTNIAITSVVPI
ncbi:MAG: hypothetical protein ACI9J5_002276, partial [Paraglaciecola sp.]